MDNNAASTCSLCSTSEMLRGTRQELERDVLECLLWGVSGVYGPMLPEKVHWCFWWHAQGMLRLFLEPEGLTPQKNAFPEGYWATAIQSKQK
eukprot:6185676-Amphidinium_carterae.1